MESQYQKWVNLSYLFVAVLVGYVVFSLTGKIAGFYDLEARFRNIDLILRGGSIGIGALLFLILNRHQSSNEYMNEVMGELSKVTWPTQRETADATRNVIIMVVISGIILYALDIAWVQLLKLVLT